MATQRNRAAAPTRADVARLAHTSLSTVSYVINGGPRQVLPDTRDRVLKAIDELGYRPNMIARSLRLSSTNAIGVVVPLSVNPFFGELISAIETQARTLGKVVLFGTTGHDSELERELIQSFHDRRVDAILGIGLSPGLRRQPALQGWLAVLTGPGDEVRYATGIDQRAAARAATQHLVDHGFAEVGCITGPADFPVFDTRTKGWRDAVAHLSEDRASELVSPGEFSLSGGYAATHALFARPNPPRALYVSADMQAIGALKALHELGLRVPEDVAIVSIDGTNLCEYITPSLSSIRQPVDVLAQRALAAVDHEPTQAREELPFEFIPRESCGCVSPRAGSIALA